MGTIFSNTLKRLRKDAGFQTAYQFYHGNGKKAVLKVTYRGWLLTEEGKTLPAFRNLGILMCAMRLVPNSAEASELVLAWMKTALGEEEVNHFLGPMLKPAPGPSVSSPLHKALQRTLSQAKFHITPEQLEVMGKNRENYLCWLALSNDTGKWPPKALAQQLGLRTPDTEKALRELAAAKLLKKLPDGAYRCHMTGAMLEYPPRWPLLQTQKKALELRRELVAQGEEVYSRRGIFRASLSDLANFFPLLSLNVSTAQTYAVTKKAKGTALFAVEGRVVKIMDF